MKRIIVELVWERGKGVTVGGKQSEKQIQIENVRIRNVKQRIDFEFPPRARTYIKVGLRQFQRTAVSFQEIIAQREKDIKLNYCTQLTLFSQNTG